MRTPLLTLLFLCWSCCCPAFSEAPAAQGSAQIADIRTAYDSLRAAFEAHQLDRFMDYFCANYIDIDENGRRLTKEQTRRTYQEQLAQMKSIQSHCELARFTLVPSGTLVEMRLHSTGIGEKRILFARVRGHFTDDLWVLDLWIKTSSGWRLQHRQTLKDDLRISM